MGRAVICDIFRRRSIRRHRHLPETAPLNRISHVRNVLVSWGAFVISALAGLFLSPFVVKSLGTSGFGVWVIVTSLTGSLNFLDLGVRSAVIRFVAREHARGDHTAASRFVATARLLLLGAGALVLLASAGFAVGLEHWFTIPAPLVNEARLVLILSALTLALVLSNGVLAGTISGLQRLDVIGLTDAALELARIGLILAALSAGGGLLGLVTVGLVLALARTVVFRHYARRLYPELQPQLRRPTREDVVAILSVSAYSTLIYSAVGAVNQLSAIIIGAALPTAMVAYYSIGATLPIYAAALNRPIAQTVHPRASRLDALGDADGLRTMILDTARYSALVLLPLVLTFVLRGRTFIGVWMGDEFREPSGNVLAVLSLGIVLNGTRHVMQAAFFGSGRHKSLAPWYLGEAAITIALTAAVVVPFGIEGAAWAAVVPGAVVTLGVFPVLAQRGFGIGPARLVGHTLLRPLAAMLPFAFVLYVMDARVTASGYVSFFAQVAAALPVAILGAWTIGLRADERIAATAAIRRRLARGGT